MILTIVKGTNKKTGKVFEMSLNKFKKDYASFLRKGIDLKETHTLEQYSKELKSFKFLVWVHPKRGGDDYQTEVDQCGSNLDEAKKYLEEWLKKISHVTDDYQVVRS